MDATRTPLNRKVIIILTAALLATVPAVAAGSLNVNGGISASISLNGSNTSSSVSVTSTGDAIPFTASIDYTNCGSQNWLSATPGGTAPAAGSGPMLIYIAMVRVPSCSPSAATVTLTGGGSSATVAVTFTAGAGGGPSSPITASPSPLALQLSAPGSAQGSLTLQTANTASTSFTVSTSTDVAGWSLAVDQTAGALSASSPFVLTVTASTTLSASAIYTGTVIVTPVGLAPVVTTVTLTVNASSGGGGNSDLTLTSGSTTASNLSLTATYNTGDAVPTTIASLPAHSASGQLNYRILSIAYQTAGGWLAVQGFDGSTPTTVSIGTPLVITTASGVTSLADGSYQATVTLGETSVAGPFATVVVTLFKNTSTPAVLATPSSWTLQVGLNAAAQTHTFTITTSGGTTLGTISSDATWIQVGTLAGEALPVTVDPTGLTAGTYSGNVIVNSNAASSPLLIPISMVVSSSGGGSGAQVVAPSSLNLAYQINGPGVSPPTVTIPGPTDGSFTATASQSWIILDPPGAPLPASMLVHIDPAGLAAQSTPYSGNITITTPNGQAVIPVKLLVTNSAVVMSNPGSLTFTQTGSGSAAQKVEFSASDGSALSITPTAPSTPWVHFTQASNAFTHGQTLTVSVDATGMDTGTFGGTIQVDASGFANTPVTYPVVLVINGGGNGQGGPLTLSANALTFNAVVNGASSSKTLAVDSNAGATSFTAAVQMTTGSGWLSISPSGILTTEQDITVTASPAGLAAGTYNGLIVLTSNGVTQQVEVSLVVASTVSGGNVQVTPTSLSLPYRVGGTAPSAQLQVSNAVSGSAQVAFTVAAVNATWLTVTPTSAQTAAAITVGVNPAGLAAGPYYGTVRITPTGGSVVDVPVTLTVTAPTIAVDATSLSFTYHVGDSSPASRTVQVTGGADANFTAQASSAGGWLSVTPTSGVANPATLTVSVDPTGLTGGTSYQGTITVAGSGGAAGSASVAVTLNIVAPFPTIAGVANAASGYSGSVAPGELISLYGTELGPATPVLTQLDSTGMFVATTLGGVQVFVNGYPAPVIYASKTQVNALVPYEVKSLKSVSVWLKYANQTSNTVALPLTATAPGVLTLNSSGSGQGLIQNAADYSLNGPARPAAKGSYVILYVTGEGETLPNGTTGKITVLQTTQPITPAPLLTVVPRVDGQVAYFNFAGEAPGLVSGVMQLNVQIPANARSGDLPITVSVGGNDSQAGVTVRVQ